MDQQGEVLDPHTLCPAQSTAGRYKRCRSASTCSDHALQVVDPTLEIEALLGLDVNEVLQVLQPSDL